MTSCDFMFGLFKIEKKLILKQRKHWKNYKKIKIK